MQKFKNNQELHDYIYKIVRTRYENHKSGTLYKIIDLVLQDDLIAKMLNGLLTGLEIESKELTGLTPENIIAFILSEIDSEIEVHRYEGITRLAKQTAEDEPKSKKADETTLIDDLENTLDSGTGKTTDQYNDEDDSGTTITQDERSKSKSFRENCRIFIPEPVSTDYATTHLDMDEAIKVINPLTIEERSPDLALILIDKLYEELPFFEKEAFKLRILRKSGFFNTTPERKMFIGSSDYLSNLGAEFGILTMLFSEEEILSLQRRAAIRIEAIWEERLRNRIINHLESIIEKGKLGEVNKITL